MNRRQKIIISITGIFIILLALVGLTYAYFLTRITGNQNEKSISVTTANLELVYDDGNGALEPHGVITPGTKIKFLNTKGTETTNDDEVVDKKTFTVTNNGNEKVDSYAVVLEDLIITYASSIKIGETTYPAGTTTYLEHPNDMKLKITCISTKAGKTCDGFDETLPTTNDILFTNSIDVGETHEYVLTMEYIESGQNQSADMNKSITAKVNIMDIKDNIDMAGVVDNISESAYVKLEKISYNEENIENEFISYLDKSGNFKIVGVTPGNYMLKVYDKTGSDDKIVEKIQKKISVVKGNESKIDISGDDTIITITDLTRTAIVNVTVSDGVYSPNVLEITTSYLNILKIGDAQLVGILKNNTFVIDNTNNAIYVPSGFKVINDASNINEGIVIEDEDNNQFVWIPVKDFSLFERTTQYNGVIKQNTLGTLEPATEVYLEGNSGTTTILSLENDLTGEYAEFNAMRASVEKYKGFYIGRYETGSTEYRSECYEGTSELVIKKGAYPYRYVAWGPSMSQTTGDIYRTTNYEQCAGSINTGKGAVELSRNMYKNSESVVSTLPYGVQYDAIFTWIYDVLNPFQTVSSGSQAKYVNNSQGMGWYYDNQADNPKHLTGIDIENSACVDGICNKVKNIYDLAGNMEEWTMETKSKFGKVHRGGNYTDNGIPEATSGNPNSDNEHEERPAKYRSVNYPSQPIVTYSFRIALYLK